MAAKRNRTALLSVSDKNGIVFFAKALATLGWEILASGGTAKALKEADIAVRDIGDIVGKPILDDRVKTLHPKIHGPLVSKDTPEHNRQLDELGMPRIELVCVDLYPLKKTIDAGGSYEQVIENTDLGGVALLRSGAKGGRIVVSHPDDRMKVIEWLTQGEPDSATFRRWLAGKAELAASDYCRVSALYLLGRPV